MFVRWPISRLLVDLSCFGSKYGDSDADILLVSGGSLLSASMLPLLLPGRAGQAALMSSFTTLA
jgi:hypothetical protein